MKFFFSVLSVALVATSSVVTAASSRRAAAQPLLTPDPNLPHKYNGDNITFDYSTELVDAGVTKFGLGAVRFDEQAPTNAFDFERWEGPNVLGLDDQDVLPAVYLLNYPFIWPNATYTVQLFEFFEANGTIRRYNIRSETFAWVTKPGSYI